LEGSTVIGLAGQYGRLPARMNGGVLIQAEESGRKPEPAVSPGFAIGPFLRRMLTEGRDRLLRG
ncbi:MAG TPA: hypothetical protein VN673_02870, partial [Clostridia bacterium]|nr:hypothetical protein [Clostridia bacterium]